MPLASVVLSVFIRLRLWARHHGGELFWAAVFAVVVGLPAAVYFAYFVTDPKPYKIYVVAGSHFLTKSPKDPKLDTAQQFIASFPKRRIADAIDVDLEVVALDNDDPRIASSKARELIAKDNTLLVIGHMDSEPTEASLAVYLGARPQVPFIASVQTADHLLEKACKIWGESDKKPEDSVCSDNSKVLPYLQLSPTNLEQARWAIKYAADNRSHNFLIVENDGLNPSYVKNLADDYATAITERNQSIGEKHRADNTSLSPDEVLTQALVKKEALSDEILWGQFKNSKVDCVLYAGGFDGAGALLNQIVDLKQDHLRKALAQKDQVEAETAGRPLMVILDDSVVDERLSGTKFDLSPVHITDQVDATDYNSGVSVYGLDAIAIASELIDDMNQRPFDWSFRVKKWLHQLTVADARRNLVRVLQENYEHHAAYFGGVRAATVFGTRTVYAFDGYTRANGLFHVWKRVQSGSSYSNIDVDRWHPGTNPPDKNGIGGDSSEGTIAWIPKLTLEQGPAKSAPIQATEKEPLTSK